MNDWNTYGAVFTALVAGLLLGQMSTTPNARTMVNISIVTTNVIMCVWNITRIGG